MTTMKLQTSEALLRALTESTARAPTAEEVRSQRVSFIMGSLRDDSTVTRARVQEILKQQEGSQEHAE